MCVCVCVSVCVCTDRRAEQMASGIETQREVRHLPPNSYIHTHSQRSIINIIIIILSVPCRLSVTNMITPIILTITLQLFNCLCVRNHHWHHLYLPQCCKINLQLSFIITLLVSFIIVLITEFLFNG